MKPSMRSILWASASLSMWFSSAHAQVTRLEIESRAPIKGTFGAAGAYERVTGRYFGQLDPSDPHNAIITDLSLAPRNADGKVEYSATFAFTRPVDPARASSVLFYDTPNRGSGLVQGDPDGHIHLISGWQGDLSQDPRLQTIVVPVARERSGSPVTGPVMVRIVDPPEGPSSVALLGGPGAPRPTPLSLDSMKARLVRKSADDAPGQSVGGADWAFAVCDAASPFPGRPDPHSLCLKAGFDPAFAYELTYTAKDPAVLGVGFAAVRDLVSFLRDSTGRPDAPNPLAGQVRWALATGVSQSGNFLRSYVHLGFNEALDGRRVFDAVNPQIAARQAPLNVRFGMPGGVANLYEAGSEGVLWWGQHDDRTRRRGTGSLLKRCRATSTCPKVMEMFGSAEFWSLRMSPDLVGLEARADIPLPDEVRRYYFPGVSHGGGQGGFRTASAAYGCVLPDNRNPTQDAVRALTKALVAWVVEGKAPPASRYPTLAAGDLVSPDALAMGFPRIAGRPRPGGKLNPMLVYNFGPRFDDQDVSGIVTKATPPITARPRSLVPRVDADGNETSGVPSVQMRAPVGTYLGWNERARGYYKGGGCGLAGGFIPFAQTRAERLATNDPRLSLEERYGSHAQFVSRIQRAASEMAAEGFLLPDDAERIVRQAQESSILAGR